MAGFEFTTPMGVDMGAIEYRFPMHFPTDIRHALLGDQMGGTKYKNAFTQRCFAPRNLV